MAVLVEAQGELVNQIEKNVIDAEAYTRKGVAELKKANVYQRKSRKVREIRKPKFLRFMCSFLY